MNLLLVRTTNKYAPEYVSRLLAGVRRNLMVEAIDLFTDQPGQFPGVRNVDVSGLDLPAWWAKLALFRPSLRSPGNALYLDLDTIVLGDITGFEKIAKAADFSICGSFARQFGATTYPCKYGSCVMTFRDGWGENIWTEFVRRKEELMQPKFLKYGDQLAVERIYPDAALLQSLLPASFFLNYREIPQYPDGPPADARLLIFGGKNKPGNQVPQWVGEKWAHTA